MIQLHGRKRALRGKWVSINADPRRLRDKDFQGAGMEREAGRNAPHHFYPLRLTLTLGACVHGIRPDGQQHSVWVLGGL